MAVPDRISFPEKEEEILAWWEENGVFQESLKQSLGKPVWSFYDGPPFATGLPHYGHLLAGTIKVRPNRAPPTRHRHPRPMVRGSRARAAGRRTSSAGTRTRPATTSSAASAGTAMASPPRWKPRRTFPSHIQFASVLH